MDKADIERVKEKIRGMQSQIAALQEINQNGEYDNYIASLRKEIENLYYYLNSD